MKSLLAIWLAVLITGAGAFVYIGQAMAEGVADCPPGSYSIGSKEDGGDPICKLEPTGCPYGDSIPVDSPKCAPSAADMPPAHVQQIEQPSYAAPAEYDADPFAGGK